MDTGKARGKRNLVNPFLNVRLRNQWVLTDEDLLWERGGARQKGFQYSDFLGIEIKRSRRQEERRAVRRLGAGLDERDSLRVVPKGLFYYEKLQILLSSPPEEQLV